MGDLPSDGVAHETSLAYSRAVAIRVVTRTAERLLGGAPADCDALVLALIGEAADAQSVTLCSYTDPDGTRRPEFSWFAGARDTAEMVVETGGEMDGVDAVADASDVRIPILVGARPWGELAIRYPVGIEPGPSERDALQAASGCLASVIALSAVRGSSERRDAIVAGLAGIAELLIQGQPLDDAMPIALQTLAQASGAQLAVIWEHLSTEGGRVYGRLPWMFTEGQMAFSKEELFDVDDDYFDSVERGDVILISEGGVNPVHTTMLRKAGVAQLVIVPVFAGDTLWGGLVQGFATVSKRSPVELDAIRAAGSIFGSAIDASATHSALHESEERRRQSEKLEAIGRLAGGIAHDFNNLLTAILGYADLLYDETGSDEARQIVTAATRAASLTRQLLAFSRRQSVQTDVVDLGELVHEVGELVERVIGEDITVETVIDPDLGQVMADPGQIHQVLLNLALNGRDAMPSGGRLRIHAGNVESAPRPLLRSIGAGAMVCLTVQDDGVGMDDNTRERAFEPFFTTKAAGMGTGLGLSTVHGIVRASGGEVSFESKLGEGTTVRVWLPRVVAKLAVAPEQPTRPAGFQPGAVALVVEDDELVRILTQKTLERAGLRVVVAADPISALRRAREESRIDVLVTDVVMPMMNGHELASRFATIFPHAGVMLISGYPNSEVLPLPNTRIGFLAKPFAAEALVDAVRATLSSAQAGLKLA